jgi:hypothetical protein
MKKKHQQNPPRLSEEEILSRLETSPDSHEERPGDFCTKCGRRGKTKKRGRKNYLCNTCQMKLGD